jgi:hypothetical protein
MKVVIVQVDLDTCLSGLICGATEADTIVRRPSGATADELADPAVLCLEAGGSGDAGHNNFDHHNTTEDLGPACRQAWEKHGRPPEFERLVDYVAAVDEARPLPEVEGTTLAALFSGLRLAITDPAAQFRAGLHLLHTVTQEKLDPFGIMPERSEWHSYLEAKQANEARRQEVQEKALYFQSAAGVKAGFVESTYIGAPFALYELGCDIAIAYHPQFGSPPIPKFTIGGNPARNIRVDYLLTELNARDPGWGGPSTGTIIGSPRTGSKLTPAELVAIVKCSKASE